MGPLIGFPSFLMRSDRKKKGRALGRGQVIGRKRPERACDAEAPREEDRLRRNIWQGEFAAPQHSFAHEFATAS